MGTPDGLGTAMNDGFLNPLPFHEFLAQGNINVQSKG
jgi:hypothetical protein